EAARAATAHGRARAGIGRRAARSLSTPARRAVGASRAADARGERARGERTTTCPRAPSRARVEALMLYSLPYLIFMRLHRAALDARRRDRTWRYFAWSIAAGVLGALLVGFTFVVAWLLWLVGWWPLAIAIVLLFAVPVAQPLIHRHLLVPLGAVRTSYW